VEADAELSNSALESIKFFLLLDLFYMQFLPLLSSLPLAPLTALRSFLVFLFKIRRLPKIVVGTMVFS
jgi:hypothetical protein